MMERIHTERIVGMKLLFLDWDSYGKEDLVDALRSLGHEVIRVNLPMGDYLHDHEFARQFRAVVQKETPDAVFSSNYYPVVSGTLRSKNIPYISWVYDSPLITLFSTSVNHPHNFIFIFDYLLYETLKERGVETVYYMPMAVHTKRVHALLAQAGAQKKYIHDIAFVGSLYDNKNNLYDRMVEKGLKERTRGYLEGVMESQLLVYGKNLLEDMITEEVLADMMDAMPYMVPHGVDISEKYVYANFFLGHKTTTLERRRLLGKLSERFDTAIYTTCDTTGMPGLHNEGPVDYYDEMPLVFANSKINLNITLRTIQTGMPLRAVDIMGAGGFLLTNYQEDFFRHFKKGEEFDCFSSEEELMQKCEYYLSHEKERAEIAENAKRKVSEELTMEGCLKTMLSIAVRN